MTQTYVVNFLGDKDRMEKFSEDMTKLHELNRGELIETICILSEICLSKDYIIDRQQALSDSCIELLKSRDKDAIRALELAEDANNLLKKFV